MQVFFAIYFFLLGALLASFYNVIGIRVLDKKSIIPRSRCPKCGHQLRMVDVIPILGYTINLGKCHFCKEKIAIKYLFIEIFGGILFMASYLVFDISLMFLLSCVFSSLLMIISVSDYEYNQVLNVVIYVLAPIIFILQIIQGNVLYSAIGGALAAIVIFLYTLIDKRAKKYTLFIIAIGLSLGYIQVTVALLLIGLFLGVKKLLKIRIPNAYIISVIAFTCFILQYQINMLIGLI